MNPDPTALLGDLHLGARGGNDHQRAFIIKYLEWFITQAQRRRVKRVIQLGDMFDSRKSTNNKDIDALRHTILPMIEASGMSWYFIVGNHDTTMKTTNEINTPTSLMGDIENITIINAPDMYNFDGINMLMVPWINESNYQECIDSLGWGPDLILGHFDIKGYYMYRGVMSTHGLDPEVFPKDAKVISGHYHTRNEAGNILYVGSPYHLTWMDYPDERGFHLVHHTPKGIEIEFVPNDEGMTLFAIMEYDYDKMDEATRKQISSPEYLSRYAGKILKVIVKSKNTRHFNVFASNLKEIATIDLKFIDETVIETKRVEIDEASLITDTISVFNTYIDGQDDSINKTGLKTRIATIYDEAMRRKSNA